MRSQPAARPQPSGHPGRARDRPRGPATASAVFDDAVRPGAAAPRGPAALRLVALVLACLLIPTVLAGRSPDPPGADPEPESAVAAAETPAALLLVPPTDRSRRPRLDALAAHPDIDRVAFYLDGDPVGTDGRRPYRMKIDLRDGARAGVRERGDHRSVRAVAYGRRGEVLAEDTLDLAATGLPARSDQRSFDVAIVGIHRHPISGVREVVARISVPSGARLERIELFHNERPAERREAGELGSSPPPASAEGTRTVRFPLDTRSAGPDDYVRVVAHLDDGSSLEDARPLGGAVSADRLDVCLVDLFAVVSDRWGEPVRGLAAEDFRVRLGDREMPLERFREASEVPLALGMLVDSSESMRPIMDRTKQAARRFLEHTLTPGDEAFLVDVDTVPRLVRRTITSPDALAAAFGELEPGGTTALYDAILLGLLQLESHPGRRALVVLTDGRDYGSDFGPKTCKRHAQRAGVPIYVLSMAGLPGWRTNPERNFRLEALARDTGGRVLPVHTLEGLERAYAEIDRELRNQYVLSLGSDRVLTASELAGLEVQVLQPGARVRATHGAGH